MNRIASILTGLSLAVLFFVGAAHAQFDGPRMKADIPFEFTVGKISFPAGQYEFVRTGANLVLVRDADGRGLFTVTSGSFEPNWLPEKSVLRFNAVDGRYALVQIWNEPSASGVQFPYKYTSVELAKPATNH